MSNGQRRLPAKMTPMMVYWLPNAQTRPFKKLQKRRHAVTYMKFYSLDFSDNWPLLTNRNDVRPGDWVDCSHSRQSKRSTCNHEAHTFAVTGRPYGFTDPQQPSPSCQAGCFVRAANWEMPAFIRPHPMPDSPKYADLFNAPSPVRHPLGPLTHPQGSSWPAFLHERMFLVHLIYLFTPCNGLVPLPLATSRDPASHARPCVTERCSLDKT